MHYSFLFGAFSTDRHDKREKLKEIEEEKPGGKGKMGERKTEERERKALSQILPFHPHTIPWK